MKQREQTQINYNYFKTWTQNMAYVLGLWFADGNIYSPKRDNGSGYYFYISQNEKDAYILKQILSDMSSSHKIYKNGNVRSINLSNKTIFEDIVYLGGVERKSLIATFPHIPDEYKLSFILGYFDGDGTVYKNKCACSMLGTKEFLTTIRDYLQDNDIVVSSIRQHHPEFGDENNCYRLGIYRKAEFIKFRALLYERTNMPCFYLERKKEAFYNR